MRIGRFLPFLLICTAPVCFAQTGRSSLDVEAKACDTVIGDGSLASARTRAIDKASFAAIRKLEQLTPIQKKLGDEELNLMIYRLIDDHLEELSVETLDHEENQVCVRIKGKINPDSFTLIEQEFIRQDEKAPEPTNEEVAKAAEEAKREVSLKPENPEALALVHFTNLTYYNGQETPRFTDEVKNRLKDNAYFYLTDEADLADYTLHPKVLKAKVDALDAGHKRLQMVVTVEISGLETDIVNAYQNRFVVFGAEEDEQQIAARLIRKLLENATDEAVRRIEHKEQLKFEKNTLGKTISE